MRKCNFIEALRGLLIRSRRVRSSTLAPVHGRVYRYMYMPPPPPSRARNGALLFVRLVAVAFATPWRFASLRAAPQPPPAPSELAERACVDGCAIFFRRRAPFYLTRPRAIYVRVRDHTYARAEGWPRRKEEKSGAEQHVRPGADVERNAFHL